MDLKEFIRDVPDFPKKGIVFKDITPLLKNPQAFKQAIDLMVDPYRGKKVDKVVAVESRGFIFGSAVAYKLGCGFVPVRKRGKLPYKTVSVQYELEYGTDVLEMHVDAIDKGEKVMIVDDLLATGGTARAVAEMIEKNHGQVIGIEFLIELAFLNGKIKLTSYPVSSHIIYR